MTTTTSDYSINIPIQGSFSIYLSDMPTGMSREELLAKLDADTLYNLGELIAPYNAKEAVWEAQHTIENKAEEIDFEEQPND